MSIFYLQRNRFFARILYILVFLACSFFSSYAQPVISFASFISGLTAPLDLVNAGDGSNRLFIVQRNGTIRIHNGTSLLPTPFIDLKDTVLDNGEQGLLSMAFHPNYAINRYFFVYYTDKEGDITLARYQTSSGNPNVADPLSEVVLLELPKPGTPYFTNHNGGKINFGADGYLYVSIGDGGSGGDPFNNAQNGNSLLGKMLRLDINNFLAPPYYSIPPDNPYISNPSVRDEIWAMGLRNPWRWSFDRQTNNIWIADVGQGLWEEIDYRAAGTTGGINYGWRCYEGNNTYNTSGCLPPANYVPAIFNYPHNSSTGGFSVTGGYVYRGLDFPLLTGYYLCADYVSGNLWKIRPDGAGGWNIFQQNGLPGSIAGFGESETGVLYAVSLGGTVYRVEANSALPVRLLNFTAQSKKDAVLLEWQTSFEEQVASFEIEFSFDGIQFDKAGLVLPVNNKAGSRYSFTHQVTGNKKIFYRIKTTDQSGEIEYSKIIMVNSAGKSWLHINPSILRNNTLLLSASKPLDWVLVFNSEGKEVFRKNLGGRQGIISMILPRLPGGSYIVQSLSSTQNDIQKIVIQ